MVPKCCPVGWMHQNYPRSYYEYIILYTPCLIPGFSGFQEYLFLITSLVASGGHLNTKSWLEYLKSQYSDRDPSFSSICAQQIRYCLICEQWASGGQ